MRIALEIPPGIIGDDTTYAAPGRWGDCDGVRFRGSKPETVGGWELVTDDLLTGVCRSVLAWTDNTNNALHLAFGTNEALQLWTGGQLYDITPTADFTLGAENGTGSVGWSTGAYGVGTYSTPSASDYFPLTWSLAAWGQKLLGNPRGQTIFEWSNNTAVEAAAISSAPDNVTYMLVAPTRQVFALGCNEEGSGTFNPVCIRHSSVGDNTDWTTTSSSASTAREYILPGGGRIVSGRMVGRSLLVWTNQSLFLGTYYGQIGKVWGFERVGDKCGLIGPNAVAVFGSTAYWIGPDRQFRVYSLGGTVDIIPCPVRTEFSEYLSAAQSDKIVGSTISEYAEVRFDYPDSRDGFENSRYVSLCVTGPDAGAWYKGQIERSAMVDAGPSSYPCGVSPSGSIYWHEKGAADGDNARSCFIETSDIELDDQNTVLARTCWPDLKDQEGPVWMTVITRNDPEGDETTFGPYAIAPSQDRVDFKIPGRLFRIRFAANSLPARFRIGRPVFDVKSRGRK